MLGFNGPPYTLNLICAHPFCLERATERHHVWRRSLLGGAFDWVELPDGGQIGNLVGFCHEHHRLLTDDEAKLSLEGVGVLAWISDSMQVLPLTFQPPFLPPIDELLQADPEFRNTPKKTGAILDNECPSCGRPLPHPKIEREPDDFEEPRPRRSWTITVPVDQRENGAAILDALVEGCREALDRAGISYSPGPKTKFAVTSSSLALFLQHFDEIVSDG